MKRLLTALFLLAVVLLMSMTSGAMAASSTKLQPLTTCTADGCDGSHPHDVTNCLTNFTLIDTQPLVDSNGSTVAHLKLFSGRQTGGCNAVWGSWYEDTASYHDVHIQTVRMHVDTDGGCKTAISGADDDKTTETTYLSFSNGGYLDAPMTGFDSEGNGLTGGDCYRAWAHWQDHFNVWIDTYSAYYLPS